MNYDVAILTGWSNNGGSTESYINLTNAFNANGINTIMIGPHQWHLNKCKSGTMEDIGGLSANNIIWHFFAMNPQQDYSMLMDSNSILSCHETGLNPIFKKYKPYIDNGTFNYFHFVSKWQLDWHLTNSQMPKLSSMKVIPNLLDPKLEVISPESRKLKTKNLKIGGIIGSIDRNKSPHIAIQRAFDDGCDKVRIFGHQSDPTYYINHMQSIFKDPRVIYHGIVDDKNKMYNSITDVYHSSGYETWGYIEAECKYLNIPFHSTIENNISPLSTSTVISHWKKLLVL